MNDLINPADVRFQVLKDIQKGLKSRVEHATSDARGAITFSLFLAGVLFAGFLAIGFLTINLNNRLNNIESVISQPPPEPVITLAKEMNFT